MKVSTLALRCMAFLTGIDQDRPTRARLAAAVKRSERSVKRAIAELVEIQWITCAGGGNGTPSKINILNRVDWILARDSKTASDQPILALDCEKMARDEPILARDKPRIRDKEVVLEQERTNEGMRSLVRDYFGQSKIKGRQADEALISRIASVLGTPAAFSVFCQQLKEFGRIPESWGFMIWAADRVKPKPIGRAPTLDYSGDPGIDIAELAELKRMGRPSDLKNLQTAVGR